MRFLIQPSALLALVVTASVVSSSTAQHIGTFGITSAQLDPTGVTLQWNDAGSNYAYTVLCRATLADTLWLWPANPSPWPIQSTNWTAIGSNQNPSQFYRVVAVPQAQRGKLIKYQAGGLYQPSLIAILLSSAGVSNLTAQYAVQLHKIVYETTDPLGARTIASAALAVPQNVQKPVPLFSYQHGTITLTNDAPSTLSIFGEAGVGVAIATAGYLAVLPDFLGLGDSPGLHPYLHARSEATACVDALRAARIWCESNHVSLSSQLFLAGYSQGGHVTMALHRELEMYHTNEFTITASAPMSGPYDMSGVTTEDILSGRPQPNPYYFAYLLAAYQSVYHIAASLGDMLQSPYNSTLPPLLAGNADGDQINLAMPASHVPTEILKPEFLESFRTNANHLLRQALRDNDLYAWTPQSPMHLYHCDGDGDVIYANSQVAHDSFQSRGATQVQLINPQNGANHSSCAIPALLQAKAWFDMPTH